MLGLPKLKLIHHAVRKISMADEDYRTMLRRVAGVDSSKTLDDAGFDAVMAEFKRLGFTSSRRQAAYGERPGMASGRQVGLIHSLWRQYCGDDDENGLRLFLEKKFAVSSLRFVDTRTCCKIICTLRRMAEWRKMHPRTSRKHEAAKALGDAINSETDSPPF